MKGRKHTREELEKLGWSELSDVGYSGGKIFIKEDKGIGILWNSRTGKVETEFLVL